MSSKHTYRISNAMAGLWLLLGGIADALTLIPFVGIAVGPLFWISFNVYLMKAGYGIMNGRRLATGIVSTVAELLPAVQAIPTIFGGVLIVIIMLRTEDRTGIKIPTASPSGKMNVGGVRQPPPRIPLNHPDGLRPPSGGLAT